MALEKAYILILQGNKKNTKIPVLFNPNEYTIVDGNNYSPQHLINQPEPIAEFTGGKGKTLNMELFFDTYENKTDVRYYTSQIAELLDREVDLHHPPLCQFVWGPMNFKGVIEEITQKFTMFLDTGTPVRAKLDVKFLSCKSVKEQNQENPLQSSDRTKQRTMKQGEHLWMIAEEEYEDPGYWREIAKANNIDNPKVLTSGKQLIVPPLE